MTNRLISIVLTIILIVVVVAAVGEPPLWMCIIFGLEGGLQYGLGKSDGENGENRPN